MYEQFQQAHIDMRHVLIDPPDSPEDTATEVLRRYRHRTLAWTFPDNVNNGVFRGFADS